jgi:hypothetical protein
LGNVATLVNTFAADRVPRYNLFAATEINGDTLPTSARPPVWQR